MSFLLCASLHVDSGHLTFFLEKTCKVSLYSLTIKMMQIASAVCQRRGLAVPRTGNRSYVMGSIHGWSRSHLT